VSLRFLLDTNILSEATKKQPNPDVLEKLKQHRNEVGTASVVWHEAWFGCQRLPQSRKRQKIEHYLIHVVQASIPLLPYDAESAKWHAIERARLTLMGQTPPFVDGQIAAIAKVNQLILVTGNPIDFQNFVDLQVENWYDAGN
jgi:tRNA(fMet)-specific endonuclease VapC